MIRALLISVLPLLSGCNQLQQAEMLLIGSKKIVLSNKPLTLGKDVRTFASHIDFETKGITNVCVVLKDEYRLPKKAVADADFASFLNGAKLTVVLKASNGAEYPLAGTNKAWSSDGVISSSPELSACSSSVDGKDIPDGTKIESVRIGSDKVVEVLGAYVESLPSQFGPN